MMGILEILCGIIVFIFALHYYYTLKFDFWKNRGIPGPKPMIYFGTAKDIMLQKKHPMEYYKEVYNAYKDASLVGLFFKTTPILLIKDPALIKDVLITDATIFAGRGIFYSKKAEPLLNTFFFLKGEEALPLRTITSVLFTPSKLKNMMSLLTQHSEVFKNWLDNSLLKNEQINCSELTDKLIADFTGICLLNYDGKTFQDKKVELCKYIKKFNKGDSWKWTLKHLLPDKVIYNKLYDLISYYLFDNVELMQFCTRFATDIVNYKREHNIFKHDVVKVLTEMTQNGESTEKAGMLNQYVSTHLFLFFMAAYDSSAVTLSNALYELALNHTIQDRLREEIKTMYIKNNGEITFNDINTMIYLDAVSKETMRKYPITAVISRQASSTYTFRNSQLTVPKGQIVNISVSGIHFDPEIYPKPEIFDPERFIGEAARFRNSMHYLAFGHGLRNCIGERFGILQFKMGLITLLRNYKFDVCEKTPAKLKYVPAVLIEHPDDIYLKVTKIE